MRSLSALVYLVGFEVLTAVSTNVAPFSLVEVYQRFRGPCCRHHQGHIAMMMEAAWTTETVVNFYQTTRRYNPEDSHLRLPRSSFVRIAYSRCHTFLVNDTVLERF
jgi:hypothetical protein